MLQSRLLTAIITIKVKFLIKVMLGDLKFARNKLTFEKLGPVLSPCEQNLFLSSSWSKSKKWKTASAGRASFVNCN